MKWGFLLFITMLGLFFSRFPVFADDAEENNEKLIYIALSITDDAEESLYQLFEEIITLELRRLGFRVVKDDEQTSLAQDNVSGPLKAAREKHAPYMIYSHYFMQEDKDLLRLTCYDVNTGAQLATVTKTILLNLTVDTDVAEGLRELITDARIPLPVRTARQAKPSEESESGLSRHRFFEISTGFAPFLTTGSASNYFTLGLEPRLYFGFHFKEPADFLKIGFFSSMNYFIAKGILLETTNYFIAIGPDIRFLIASGNRLDLIIQLAGGPAIFIVTSEKLGTLSKAVPFALGGVGLAIKLTQAFGLAVNLNYSAYFEMPLIIMGFTPSLNVYLRF
jgi:hypothetical protein